LLLRFGVGIGLVNFGASGLIGALGDPITIRRLLSHQSGIREYSGLDEVFSTKHFENPSEAAESIFVQIASAV
jgi:CubicO group peptidase (beta-lactamase class C family)